MKDKLNESRKAIVGAATPGLVLLINNLTVELSKQASAWIAVAATGALVFLTKNKPAPQP